MKARAVGTIALLAERGLARFKADPIEAFRFSSDAQRRFVACLSEFDETALQAANQAGKTTIAGYAYVGMSRGCLLLDGESLPLLGTPNVIGVLVKGREMAKESVIKMYRQAIGAWPHHLEKNGNDIAAIWVKPNRSRSDEWRDWSCIRFFVEGGQSVAGMRLDAVHADEPPHWPSWQELRMRGRANRRFPRSITFTPIDKREWRPLRDDFVGCERPGGKDGKVVIRMSIYDNKALSQAHLRSIEMASMGPLQKAKLYGDYVDLTGTNPFDGAKLDEWESRCVPGEVVRGISPGGYPFEYEVWGKVDEREEYLVVADPSAGIEDEAHDHDPAGIVVVGRGSRSVVVRYNGYMASRDLGWLGAKLAREWNKGLLVWERNSGYGESFYHGTGGYGNVYVEHHHDARGVPLSQRIGWLTTATTRGTIIGALQGAILEDGLTVYSLAAVRSLKEVVLRRDGLRPEAGSGSHDEDMIILGLSAHLLETMPFRQRPQQKGSKQFMDSFGLRPNVPRGTNDPFVSW